jgi:phage terminase large subunit GpA-like protein
MSVSEWADENLVLSPEYAAEPGRWKTLHFQKEILDSISDPLTSQVVIRASTQTVKTSAITAAIGWAIDTDPGPILVVQPRGEDAKKFSKERIAPMIRDTPVLAAKVSDSKSKFADNTIDEKWFQGGLLAITSAGSPGNLARRAIRYLFCDEEDKWIESAGIEGDPFSLAKKRGATFRHRFKAVRACSPTVPGSKIDLAYEESDKRELYVPCPYCGHSQSMMGKFYSNVIFDSTLPNKADCAATARYQCENAECKALWTESERQAAVEQGQWIAHAPFRGIAGFWISELYSPWKTLHDIVLDFLTKKDNHNQLVTFINTSLAENWVDKGEAPDWQAVLDRREPYPVGVIPKGGLFLTAGVDVQRDRLEAEVVAWGRNRESWSVAYEIFEGKTSDAAVWGQLDTLLKSTFLHEGGGALPISKSFVDSGDGTTTNDVYMWARRQPPDRVTAIKGDIRSVLPVSQPSPVEITVNGKKWKSGLRIKTVNVNFFKAEFYADLKKQAPTAEELAAGAKYPAGYCHFPDGKNYGDEHFKQLCAEQLMSRVNKRTGRTIMEWQQTRPRNESLDGRIYARAAAWELGLDRATEQQWKLLEQQVAPKPPDTLSRSGEAKMPVATTAAKSVAGSPGSSSAEGSGSSNRGGPSAPKQDSGGSGGGDWFGDRTKDWFR